MRHTPAALYQTLAYGDDSAQCGDLYQPAGPVRGLICLLHGGFWTMPYDRSQLNKMAQHLVADGWLVWNIEYRRVPVPGAGFPGTCDDVVTAINHLLSALTDAQRQSLPLYVVGHSAGGHLALWLNSCRERLLVAPRLIIALAPVVDLVANHQDAQRRPFIEAFIGGSLTDRPDRYAQASPLALASAEGHLQVLHGAADEMLPLSEVEDYVRQVQACGGDISLTIIPQGRHMDFTDLRSPSFAAFKALLDSDNAGR